MSARTEDLGIVVGVDGSAASTAAVEWATHDAALRHRPLTVVHVVNPATPTWRQFTPPTEFAVWQGNEGRRILDGALKIARDIAGKADSIAITSQMTVSATVPPSSSCPSGPI